MLVDKTDMPLVEQRRRGNFKRGRKLSAIRAPRAAVCGYAGRHMKALWPLLAICALVALEVPAQRPSESDAPRFTADGGLERPANYREWIWLSSGLGMSYNAPTSANADASPHFDNVFVTPAAYRAFVAAGTWPDQTMFVLELRASESQGSINRQGRYQGALRGIEVEVKDERRFPGKWAFFGFDGAARTAQPFARSAACYSCHARNGAVDNTFVQFYPTLLEIARRKGTLRAISETPVTSDRH